MNKYIEYWQLLAYGSQAYTHIYLYIYIYIHTYTHQYEHRYERLSKLAVFEAWSWMLWRSYRFKKDLVMFFSVGVRFTFVGLTLNGSSTSSKAKVAIVM